MDGPAKPILYGDHLVLICLGMLRLSHSQFGVLGHLMIKKTTRQAGLCWSQTPCLVKIGLKQNLG